MLDIAVVVLFFGLVIHLSRRFIPYAQPCLPIRTYLSFDPLIEPLLKFIKKVTGDQN